MAFLTGFLLSPRVCKAGCGDPVLIHGHQASMTHSMPDPLSDANADDRAAPSLPHRPCRGPGCSNRSIPPQAPAPGSGVSIDRWALAPGDFFLNPVSCSRVLAEPLQIVTDGFRLGILRPPR